MPQPNDDSWTIQTPAASGMLKVTPPRPPSTMFHSPLPGFTGASADLLHLTRVAEETSDESHSSS
jgi:hypothetical protein